MFQFGFIVKRMIKAVMPYGLLRAYRYFKETNYCPICKKRTVFTPFGIISRPKAACGHCGSLERHRFLWMFLKKSVIKNSSCNKKILHIAAESCLQNKLSKIYNTRGGGGGGVFNC